MKTSLASEYGTVIYAVCRISSMNSIGKNAYQVIVLLCVMYILYLASNGVSQLVEFTRRYYWLKEKASLAHVYAGEMAPRKENMPWAVITGGSSGQGRQFALQLAQRGFHIVLIGSVRSHPTAEEVRRKGVMCKVILKDFGRAFESTFFDDIRETLRSLNVAILVNNVGHRTGWKPYHETPPESIRNTIACGTIVQARLTHIVMPQLLKRMEDNPTCRSCIIFVTVVVKLSCDLHDEVFCKLFIHVLDVIVLA